MGCRGPWILGFMGRRSMTARLCQPAVPERKTPKQARAFKTRAYIFEATARIIEEQGAVALTTNAIAARAGISIGTLYGHFANREAILIAMARRQLLQDEEAMLTALARTPDQAVSRVRLVVRVLLDQHRTRPAVRRAIMATHHAQGFSGERVAVVGRTIERIAAWRASAGRPPVETIVLLVVTRAILGLVHMAFEEASSLLDRPELEDELTLLAEGYLARRALLL